MRARGVAVARAGVEVVRDVDLELAAGEVVVADRPERRGQVDAARRARRAAARDARDGRAPRARRRRAAGARARAAHRAGERRGGARVVGRAARRDRRERALAALHAMGARGTRRPPGRARSPGGEARRVHLARALALEADALLLDEPFAGLDAPTRAELLYDAASALRDAAPRDARRRPRPRRGVGARRPGARDARRPRRGGRAAGDGVRSHRRPPEVAAFVGFAGRLEEPGHASPPAPAGRRPRPRRPTARARHPARPGRGRRARRAGPRRTGGSWRSRPSPARPPAPRSGSRLLGGVSFPR